MRVLLVEDDDRVARALAGALRRRGLHVVRAANGADALTPHEVDLVLLDMGLPDMDGVEVCRKLRRVSGVPVIAVTARGEEPERVRGLRSGADDYVVKPFGIEELLARMEAVLRRAHGPVGASTHTAESSVVEIGGLRVNVERREVTVAGEPVELTRKEFDVMAVLAREPGLVVTRERLVEEVWQTTWAGTSRSLDVHVATLRRKLGDPGFVQTVRGVGYRL
ncbi:MAG: response regulator transcription factor, partial [Actinomycetes bacterium]